jgi:hypothetical protein
LSTSNQSSLAPRSVRPWNAIAIVLAVALVFPRASVRAAESPQGYQLFKGDQARRALAGTLLRIAVREVVRADGSKATVYRDVDYPVRGVGRDGRMDTGRPRAATDEADTRTQAEIDAAESRPAPDPEAYVMLGPEYEDPPPAGASPSPNRLRRAGPALVIYEWDEYAETNGKGDEYLRLELDFSGTHVAVRAGIWRLEAEAGEPKPTSVAGFDFFTEQGAYGAALGRIETRDLTAGVPEEITVTLARIMSGKAPDKAIDPNRDLGAVRGGKGSYRLKRVPTPP